MSKKIFVLLVALIFFSSIIYFVFKDVKIIREQREENNIKLREESEELIENKEEFIEKKQTQEEFEFGFIQIDKIGLYAEVKEESSEEVLENYVGHIEKTSMFNGNVGLAAHNRGAIKNYFEDLNKLVIGDEIIYKTKLGSRKYKVYKISEILDTDWSKFDNTVQNELTLITCVNNKVNVRLCVQAREG